ncbi:unnamed protein product [Lactuca saligna]|uniref:MLO-like protein n=1 Tax=Lactuca saligna TaxID=75948 RepID=A0AA35ZDD5_LACSI|nr:unnamed protein product [Lactuca saligna]
MVVEGAASNHALEEAPTWALATVCFVFIFLGLVIERLFRTTSTWLQERRKTALYEAVEMLKEVLMLLGLMSLLLVVTQRGISKICISNKVAYSMLPCDKIPQETTKTIQAYEFYYASPPTSEPLTFEDMIPPASTNATFNSSDYCASKGMISFISQEAINQLNTFICALAIMQIVYSVATMALGRAKMRSWKAWEKETQTMEYLVANDSHRFRFTRQTTFGQRHMNDPIDMPILLWIKCFFRQFFHSVAKVDYFTLRHGFISAHLSRSSSFNFHKYIQRSLEDDFKLVVGISPLMRFLLVIFMLIDVHGWHMYLWVSFLPLIIVLVVGTKLQVIVARMALQLKEQNKVIIGAPLVTPNDNLFWFSKPQFVLTLLHYTLFMNAFEVAFIIWVTLQYGIDSCFHETKSIVVARILLAVIVQVICSYITLPLYALVTQMGSRFKSAVLKDQTREMIKQWHQEVKQNRRRHSQTPHDSPMPHIITQMNSTEIIPQQPTSTLSKIDPRGIEGTSEIVKEIQEVD